MAIKENLKSWLAKGKAPPAEVAPVARLTVWLRRAVVCLALVPVMWAISYAVVPVIVKSQIEKIASDKLGRQVSVGSVDFKPWSLELTLNNLAMAKAGAAPAGLEQLRIQRIYVNADLESLLRLAPVVDALEIDAPVVTLTHLGQGRYDIDDVLARLAPAADAPASEPPRFALYNLTLQGGQLDFIDQPMGKTHALRDLRLAIPFLSNLPSQREIKTAPHLAFRLGGSSFDTTAVATPFAQTRKTDATLKLSGFDLRPYAAYLPASLPFQLQAAVLDIDAKIAFEQSPNPVVRVSGVAALGKVQLLEKSTASSAAKPDVKRPELLAFDQLRITLQDIRPLEKVFKLSSVELTAPTLHLTRDRAGRLKGLSTDLQDLPAPATATKIIAARAVSASAGSPSGTQAVKPPGNTVKVQVTSLAVRSGSIVWLDETLPAPTPVTLSGLTVNASALAWPFAAGAPVQFDGATGFAADSNARLTFTGSATDQAAQVTATVAAWPLKMASPYVGQFLLPSLAGQLDAQLGASWQAALGDQAMTLRITAPQIAVSDLLLAQGKLALASGKRIELTGVDMDVPGKTFKAGTLQFTRPQARVERGADQRWAAERWLLAPAVASAATAQSNTAPARAAGNVNSPAWAVAIREVGLEGGVLSFSDQSRARPVALELSGVKAQLRSVVLGGKPAQAGSVPIPMLMPLSASLRLTSGRFEPGNLDFKGSVGLTPLQARGELLVRKLPLQAFEPYFGDLLNVDLQRADTSFKGQVAWTQRPDGPQLGVRGDVALEDFKVNSLMPSEDLLAWKSLDLRGLNLDITPTQATRLDVRETALADFFARVIITPQGRINLQDLAKPAGVAAVDGPAAPAAPAASAVTAVAALPASQAAPSAPEPIINFGPITLSSGKVAFSDRFVKPNYSADLSELTGRLSAFSSVPASATPTLADLELRGRAEGTASLEILGKLNPLAKPLALNITGKVRDLELPPLSPYAVKYAGYGITRGKLSVDVTYQVLPDGQLTAKNKLVLNQLSFGDKVEGSTASLPVKLAVALLADRNGVIDLDLPVSGSLNDPQFSLGPVIVKVILNVIVKAITAPFSLLASALGGGDELSSVGFAPGSAELTDTARAGLDKIAKALLDRPTLQLTVVGTSDLQAEQAGLRRERLAGLLRSEKRRTMAAAGGTATNATAAATSVSVSPAEAPALLKEVYKRTDMPKPRQGVGVISIAKDLPDAEMQSLLLAHFQVGDEAIRALALQRGVAVKDYLILKNLPPARLFLGAPKAGPPDAQWTPRAELNLALP